MYFAYTQVLLGTAFHRSLHILVFLGCLPLPVDAEALSSPQTADGSRTAEKTTAAGAGPWEGAIRTTSDGVNRGARGGGMALDGDSSPENCRQARPVDGPSASTSTTVAAPRGLAMMLRGELDVSCRLGCQAAGRRDDGMARSSEGCDGKAEEGGAPMAGLSADG